jgi:hypothetical protein
MTITLRTLLQRDDERMSDCLGPILSPVLWPAYHLTCRFFGVHAVVRTVNHNRVPEAKEHMEVEILIAKERSCGST